MTKVISLSRRAAVFLLSAGLALGGMVAASSARAEDIHDQAAKFIGSLGEDAIKTAADKSLAEADRMNRFKTMFMQGFDVPAIGRFVLGTYWRQATEEQRTEFLKLFEEMVIQTYAARFSEYSGETMKVTGSQNMGDNHAIVSTEIVRPTGGSPIKIDWRILKPQGQLKIVDVIVEGVSMSVTQQQDFGSLIQRNGGQVSGLLDVLRQRYGKNG